MLPYPSTQKIRARQLRSNQTNAESKLWARLRARQLCGVKFRRQHPIGRFITDFCCVESRLVVELDGGQHAEQAKRDQPRTTLIEWYGYRVLRFWDNEVLENLEGVLESIIQALNNPHRRSFDTFRTGSLPKRTREKITRKLNGPSA